MLKKGSIKRWWKAAEAERKKVDVEKDTQAILEFLEELHTDEQFLLEQLNALEELEKEYKIGNKSVRLVNLTTQAEILEKILQRYEFLVNDVVINGERVKLLAEEWKKRAHAAGMKRLVQDKNKKPLWKMQW